jgi:hypothetical protein
MNRIPKKVHLYWDRSPMSKLQVFTVKTFHRLNPDWEIFVYTPIQNYTRNAKYIPTYTGKDYFYLIENINYVKMIEVDIHKYGIDSDLHNILRSDIFRYHIIHDEGGAWIDFDIIWLKPMSHINNVDYIGNVSIEEAGANVRLYKMTTGHFNIGILFCVPKHSLYKVLITKSIEVQNRFKNKDKYNHQAFGVAMWKELYNTLQDVINAHPDVVGLPYELSAPYGIYDLDRLYRKTDLSVINNNVIGVHWFNGHKLGKEYVNGDLFEKNYPCSMTKILKRFGYGED